MTTPDTADTAVERVVLLDEAARPIGSMPKSEVHTADTPLHLAFSCHVVDDEGRENEGWKPRHQLQAGRFFNSRGIPVSPNRILPRRRIVEPIPLFPLSEAPAGRHRRRRVA